MRTPSSPAGTTPSSKDESPPRLRLRRFLHRSRQRHAIVVLDGVLSVDEALVEFLDLATRLGRVPVVVGPPGVGHLGPDTDGAGPSAVQVLPESHMRRPTDFVGRLDRVLNHHARPGAPAMLAFAPSPPCTQVWADVEALLDTRGEDGPARLCLPAPEALVALGPPAAELLARRHSAALRF